MAKKAAAKQKQTQTVVKDRTVLEWILLILLLLIALLFLAQTYRWWPYNTEDSSGELGTAFYSSRDTLKANKGSTPADKANTNDNNNSSSSNDASSDTGADSNTGNTTQTGNSSDNDSSNSNDNDDEGTANGNSTGDSDNDSRGLLNLAAAIDTGMTREALTVAATGLSQKCTVVLDTSVLGRQEVCLFTQDGKLITVTLLDNKVLSASLSRSR